MDGECDVPGVIGQSAAEGLTTEGPIAVSAAAAHVDAGHDASELESLRERVADLERELAHAEDRAVWLQEIGTALTGSVSQDELLAFVMDRIRLLMASERATLFLLEEDGEHIWSRTLTNNVTREIRLRVGEGIAGWVASTGKSVNVKDARRDPRFAERFDSEHEVETRSVLCQPVRTRRGRILGVVQVINRDSGYFTVGDEQRLSSLAATAGIFIENFQMYLEAIDVNLELRETEERLQERVRYLDTLYELQRSINAAEALEHEIETISRSAASLIPSRACIVTVDDGTPRSWVYLRGGRNVFRAFERPGGGQLAQSTREREAIATLAEDSEMDDALFRRLQLEPIAHLTAPLIVDDRVLGGIELLNRHLFDETGAHRGFVDEDVKLLTLIAGQVSTAISAALNRDQRARQERIAAIGSMLNGIVHDLRGPLTIASGYVQLMERADDADKRAQWGGRVRRQLEAATDMTREVLSYARGETNLLARAVDLQLMVADMREALELEFRESNIAVIVRGDVSGSAYLDEGKVRRIVHNLARNAREAMTDGGTYTVDIQREGETLVLTCRDTGCGIPEHIRPRLYDAFVSSGKATGTGLGLAIVKKLVEEHRGTIDFESETGVGTTFVVRLPVSEPEAAAD